MPRDGAAVMAITPRHAKRVTRWASGEAQTIRYRDGHQSAGVQDHHPSGARTRYLRDLFYLLPDWPKSRVLELAPAYFEQTLQQEEAKRRLAENPLRRALLAFVR